MSERNGEFGRYGDDELELVGMTDCGDCPIDFEDLKFILEKKFGCEVVLGTHSY
jgi:predicted metal-binding protein